ncbi:MAG: ATP-binding protein [Candidatus Aminicenantes bacterium]|nr:ATP-binding protein [Candidatus Aminicenantes bacterium]
MDKLKEIVVLSGKGGTGKTTIASSLAVLFRNKIIADADVDAANMYILMNPDNIKGGDFAGKPVAKIDSKSCINCGICMDLCRFDAIDIIDGQHNIDQLSCDGCTLCSLGCPEKAIQMEPVMVGKWFSSDTEYGKFVYARLDPGAENSGNLVTMVKHQAKLLAESEKMNYILIDGPPGIGCPVTSTLSGADYTIIVTEPSISGISDLKRIIKLSDHFKVKSGIVINKYDINSDNTKKIEAFANENNIDILGKVPHSFCIIDEISKRTIPVGQCRDLKEPITEIYKKITDYFELQK